MIKRIHIKGFKSLADVEVHLQPLSVLFGPNASGKSNFLEALGILSSTVSIRSLKDSFGPLSRDVPTKWFTRGSGSFEGPARKERLSFSIEADVYLSDAIMHSMNISFAQYALQQWEQRGKDAIRAIPQIHERDLRYRVEIELLPESNTWHVADEYLAVLNADGQPNGNYQPFIEHQSDKIHLRTEDGTDPIWFGPDRDRTTLSSWYYSFHPTPHAQAVRQELKAWLHAHITQRGNMRQLLHIAHEDMVNSRSGDLATFLYNLKEARPGQFADIEEILHRLYPGIDGIEFTKNDLDEAVLCLKKNRGTLPDSTIPGGALRILGLLTLTEPHLVSTLVGLENPENGIYPGTIPAIVELLEARARIHETQFIVTTHSPTLLDCVPQESVFVVRQIDGQTRIDPLAPKESQRNGSAIGHARGEDHAGMRVSERILRGDFDA